MLDLAKKFLAMYLIMISLKIVVFPVKTYILQLFFLIKYKILMAKNSPVEVNK
jgi:hypothetical protein